MAILDSEPLLKYSIKSTFYCNSIDSDDICIGKKTKRTTSIHATEGYDVQPLNKEPEADL